MFTMLSQFLKPILGKRDHIPTTAISPVDPEDGTRGRPRKENKRSGKKETQADTEDSMSFSLDAVKGILQQQLAEDLDMYEKVNVVITALKAKQVREITVGADEQPLEALEKLARHYGVASPLAKK
ncbi:MAG: hypothetical protein HND56_05625 [Pseudomonadota bacterium]|nr:hypothetical protein [Pseudomonadota bacterium]QKK05200.1 MAG: hypothetical protein HND56_05625 [Pseudomonadota bacterium]